MFENRTDSLPPPVSTFHEETILSIVEMIDDAENPSDVREFCADKYFEEVQRRTNFKSYR
jgi:hypothetical protein